MRSIDIHAHLTSIRIVPQGQRRPVSVPARSSANSLMKSTSSTTT
jgi:hypothetical protein